MKRTFGRYRIDDERDRGYLMRAKRTKRTSRSWRYGRLLDQGGGPQCVGYSWAAWFLCSPISQLPMQPEGIYRFAQHEDEWVGNNYDGSSVRGAAKALTFTGHITEYRWAFNVDTVVNYILEKGPVVLGTNWYAGMEDGLRMTASGRKLGGHSYLAYGANQKRETISIRNSWGSEWGRNGNGTMGFGDLERLLREDGEACTAVEARIR